MATGTLRMDSRALQGATTYSIILPDPAKAGPGPYPVLLQLHGMHDDHTAWLDKSRLWIYVERLPLIVVMPSGGNFWWSNLRLGQPEEIDPAAFALNYEDYLVRDLREHIEGNFPTRRGVPWAIGGLSMGGFGAVRLGLKYPNLFCSVYAHSSALLSEREFAQRAPILPAATRADMDVYRWAALRTPADLPRLSFDCGLADNLLGQNRYFHAYLEKRGLPHRYAEYPGGHTWDYWDLHVQEALVQHCEVLGIAPFAEPGAAPTSGQQE